MIPSCILAIEDENDRIFMANLYTRYYRLMYFEINQIVHNPEASEDLLQDVIVKLIDKVGELRTKDRNHLISYVISASKNRAKNYLRDKQRHVEFDLSEYQDVPDSQTGREQIERMLIKNDTISRLNLVWDKLDERSRYILESYYILEKKPSEIGYELGIKPDSVRMALTRARKVAFKLMTEEI